jgi:choloylglycine hydrolase
MKRFATALAIALVTSMPIQQASACTGITLVAEDGAVVFARTQEWGTFDNLNSRVAIVPRGYTIQTALPGGKKGLAWVSKYGMVGVDALNKDLFIDGMNEKALRQIFYTTRGLQNTLSTIPARQPPVYHFWLLPLTCS